MRLFEKIDAGQVYFIAEMSANHAGRLEHALEIVRAAKQAGADCIKIQTYTADTMTLDCDNEYFKISGGLWDGYTLYDLYREAALPWEWHLPIKQEAARVGIDFLSTPFDQTSVDFLEQFGVTGYKIASFELTDVPLLRYVAQKKKPVLLSTGMASEQEIADAVGVMHACGNKEIVLLKCTSEYPAEYEDMNLAVIDDMKTRFGVPVGLSDHSMGGEAAVAAVLMGAQVIEKHFCLSRAIKNPDSTFSMEPWEFEDMVRGVDHAQRMRGQVTYVHTARELKNIKFRRSIFAAKDIAAGERFTEENICVIRPNAGLEPKYYERLLGTTSKRDIAWGMPLKGEDL